MSLLIFFSKITFIDNNVGISIIYTKCTISKIEGRLIMTGGRSSQ